ncbi:MAG: hypothetical protein JKY42_11595 [Flavobacteriales bacterium]|nr:hypothetical protein [Flavobacteriales bacterium]
MSAELILEYPVWYVFLCLLLGAGFSFALYRKTELSSDVSKWIIGLLSGFRFLLISFLGFLLLTPLLKSIVREVEKPIIVIAKDNSESIKLGLDSPELQAFEHSISNTINKLSEQFEVKTLTFGDEVKDEISTNYKEQQTDINQLFEEVESRFSNRNVGALIISSDGLYNKGRNPVYATSKFNFPIYTIALGDTTEKKDVAVTRVASNKLAFLGNQFPVEIDVSILQAQGEEVVVKVVKNGKVVFTEAIKITQNKLHHTISTLLNAERVGLQRYSVVITKLQDELNVANNNYDFYIDVLEGRQKIVLLTEGPHPDISAFRQAIQQNDNYDLEVKQLENQKGQMDKYNLLILNQLNSTTQRFAKQANDQGVPVLYLIGTGSSLSLFNNSQLGLSISGKSKQVSEAQAFVNQNFALFNPNKDLLPLLKQLPPLSAPFGNYTPSASADVLLMQKIGAIETENPTLYFSKNANQKYGVWIGEGIWRWRLVNYSLEGNHDLIDELIQKTIQYLSLKEDKKRFRIDYNNQFGENESILMNAQLYNQAYDKVNNSEVTVEITDEEGNTFSYTFGKTKDEYRLNAGSLEVGEYSFRATTSLNGEVFTEEGEFMIKEVQFESIDLKANHQLLNALAKQTNGQLLYQNQLDALPDIITNRNDIKPISYSHQKLSDLINLKWIFFVLLGLISVEWFIRKRTGAY